MTIKFFFSKNKLLFELSATQAKKIKVEVTKVRILSSGLCLVLHSNNADKTSTVSWDVTFGRY